MRRIVISWGILVGLGLLATLSMAACAASKAPSSAGRGNGHTTPTHSISPPSAAPSATPSGSGGVQNLVISSAEKSELTAAYAAYAAYTNLSVSDFRGGPNPGSVYYAYQPAADTYWALAAFTSPIGAPLVGTVMFRKTGVAGPWHLTLDIAPLICGEIRWFPRGVLSVWSLPTTPPPGVTC
jgi:hypothetical protein